MSYMGLHYDLTQRMNSMLEGVRVYGADATLELPAWGKGGQHTHVEVLDMTTLDAVALAGSRSQ